MAPSSMHDIHKMRDDCHPLMYVAPMLQGSSSSWLALTDNPTSLATRDSYQSMLCQIDLDKSMAKVFVSHLRALVS